MEWESEKTTKITISIVIFYSSRIFNITGKSSCNKTKIRIDLNDKIEK